MSNGIHIASYDTLSAMPWPKGRVYLVVDAPNDGGVFTYLATHGCTVDKLTVCADHLYDTAPLRARTLYGDARLVVAVGTHIAAQCAALLCVWNRLPLCYLPTDWLGVEALLDNVYAVEQHRLCDFRLVGGYEIALVPSIYRDSTRQGTAHAYAYGVSLYVQLLQCVYMRWLDGREAEVPALQATLKRLGDALQSASQYTQDLGLSLWQVCQTAALAMPEDAPHTITRYCWHISLYKQRQSLYNKYRFAAAYTVACLLRFAPQLPDIMVPADTLGDTEAALLLCGLQYDPARLPEGDDVRLSYVLGDYLPDAQAMLAVMPVFAKNWRRLVGDCGYGFYADLTADDLLRVLPTVLATQRRPDAVWRLYISGLLPPAQNAV